MVGLRNGSDSSMNSMSDEKAASEALTVNLIIITEITENQTLMCFYTHETNQHSVCLAAASACLAFSVNLWIIQQYMEHAH